MNQSSLKLKLLVAAGLAISIWLFIAGLSFYLIFERYVERVAISQLQDQFVQLVNNIKVDDAGKLSVQGTLSDPRFNRPYGGLYWQINEKDKPPVRSMSLFDEVMAPQKTSRQINGNIIHLIDGPNGSKLFSLEKQVVLPISEASKRTLNISVAVDRSSITETVGKFGGEILVGLAALYALLLATLIVVIVLGLRPLESLRRRVGEVRLGSAKRVSGNFPAEVEPLVNEVNSLLAEKHDQLERIRLRASNLAHGLKTPLTVMSAIADSVARAGLVAEGQDINECADQMYGLVERELARARMATGHASQLSSVSPVAIRMVGALKKTSTNSNLSWTIDVPADAQLPFESGDLLELLGVVLDNARKWSKSIIAIAWINNGLNIDDDGPGVPESKLLEIQKRGVRLDETVPGSGMGLGIARDIVEIYGYVLLFARSNLGGLSVRIQKL
jgi:signal transduction histidine kinase